MIGSTSPRETFTRREAAEIRSLLDALPQGRKAVRRMTVARLRHMGVGIAADPGAQLTRAKFEGLVSSGELEIDEEGGVARAMVQPHPSGNVFRVAVGVTGDSVRPDWSAFNQRYQWFGRQPKSVTSGAHLFVLAVDRWKSAVVGLHEAVSAGADRLPGSSDPHRWPWALGVRPLAAIPPPDAVRVDDLTGPQSGLPARISDEDTLARLYRAVAESPPPPGPEKLEHRVQEMEWQDVVPDVLEAVAALGKDAREPAVVARAVELGGWTSEELSARAWYTGSGVDSHIENIVRRALQFETGAKGPLQRVHGVYSPTIAAAAPGFGVAYRPAGDDQPDTEELPAHVVDLVELDRATKRHMDLQDRLADALRQRGIEPRSPGSRQPRFDLAFEQAGTCFVVEVKGGDPVSAQQVRLGVGQLLEYRHRLQGNATGEIRAALLVESRPPEPWREIANAVGIQILRADELEQTLSDLVGPGARTADVETGRS